MADCFTELSACIDYIWNYLFEMRIYIGSYYFTCKALFDIIVGLTLFGLFIKIVVRGE